MNHIVAVEQKSTSTAFLFGIMLEHLGATNTTPNGINTTEEKKNKKKAEKKRTEQGERIFNRDVVFFSSSSI